jgi:hypothetical protein
MKHQTIKRKYKTKLKRKRKNITLKKNFVKLNCSPKNKNNTTDDYTCYSNSDLYKLKDMWNARHPDRPIKTKNTKQIWMLLKEYYTTICNKESCWVRQMTKNSKQEQELLDALKRVELVAERNTPIRLDFKKNEIILRAGTGEEATAEEIIGLTLEGEGLEIAFNAAYLKDGLTSVNAPTTRLSFTAASKPAVLSGVNSDGVNDESYRYLIMPVRLAG